MATLGGAKALKLEHKIGSLEIGKEADMVAVNLNHLFTTPCFDPFSQIVYAASRTQVTDVWIAGKRLLKNSELTHIQLTDLIEEARPWIEQARKFSHHGK
jgi:5-methylthioadenosine/S-adenosylhomocysteine deaminase